MWPVHTTSACPALAMLLEVEPGMSYRLELPRPSPQRDPFLFQKACIVGSCSSLSRVSELVSGFSQPAPLQGSSLRAWQPCSPAQPGGVDVQACGCPTCPPHGSLVISPSCPSPVSPAPPGPGSRFPVSFWAGRVRSCCSSPCCRLRLWEQFSECFPV